MTTRDQRKPMPLRKQFALTAHLFKLELMDLSRMTGRCVTEVAVAAAAPFVGLARYHKHRHVPRRS